MRQRPADVQVPAQALSVFRAPCVHGAHCAIGPPSSPRVEDPRTRDDRVRATQRFGFGQRRVRRGRWRQMAGHGRRTGTAILDCAGRRRQRSRRRYPAGKRRRDRAGNGVGTGVGARARGVRSCASRPRMQSRYVAPVRRCWLVRWRDGRRAEEGLDRQMRAASRGRHVQIRIARWQGEMGQDGMGGRATRCEAVGWGAQNTWMCVRNTVPIVSRRDVI